MPLTVGDSAALATPTIPGLSVKTILNRLVSRSCGGVWEIFFKDRRRERIEIRVD